MSARLRRFIPLWEQLSAYSKGDLLSDFGAGLTVAAVLLPQGMAYAMLAGLPPVVGLYASTLPLVAYAVFGTSRQLAVGPVAMDSLLVATAVSAIAQQGSRDYLLIATLLALMVGSIQALMAVLRLGFIVNFLGRPVVAGFSSAAALVIGLGQLKHLLGIELGSSPRVQDLLAGLFPKLPDTHLLTLFVGAVSLCVLWVSRKLNKRLPSAFFVLVLSTVLVALLGLEDSGVRVLGAVPSGLPSLQLGAVSVEMMVRLLPASITIALVGSLEAISIGKSFASKHRYEIRPNQELFALGVANASSYLVGGYPVTGGFSRTAVNDDSGARTSVASLFSAGFVLLALFLLTPFLSQLPAAALAAIVLLAVSGLFDYKGFKELWRVQRPDAGLFAVTFAATAFVGIQHGILFGVVASLGLFIYRSTNPHSAELGLIPGTTAYRNLKNFPEAEAVPGVLILRIDAAFYFANVAFFKDRIERLIREDPHDCRSVLIDASAINAFDSSADAALRDILHKLRGAGRQLYLANVKGPVREVMKASGLWDEVSESNIYLDIHTAVRRLNPDWLAQR